MEHVESSVHISSSTDREVSHKTLVRMEKIWKAFDGVAVLKGVDFDLRRGETHALLGGNGSGKSTLMKILSGVYTRGSGTVLLDGTEIELESPADAHQHGIYLVPQEPKIFPNLSVLENIVLGMESFSDDTVQEIRRYAEELGFESGLEELAGNLSIANQQLLEIIRGLIRKANVLILDEPTSTLTFREVESLFERMRALMARGIGLIFISHRLTEILTISDRVSVLRDGVLVLTQETGRLTEEMLVKAMLPANTANRPDETRVVGTERSRAVQENAEPVLVVSDLSGLAFHDISLILKPGEVLGLAGVVGAGRTELAEAIAGIDNDCTGTVTVTGTSIAKRTPRRCKNAGLVYVPEDRHKHGIFLDLANSQTISSGILSILGRVFLSAEKEQNIAKRFVDRLRIKVSGLTQMSRTLSGGNQQKVVLAKSLASEPSVIILDEPTRGVDAQARQDVYRLVQDLTQRGVGILLISSDLEEVLALSDRILVMYHGRVTEEYSQKDASIEMLTAAAFGLKRGETAQ